MFKCNFINNSQITSNYGICLSWGKSIIYINDSIFFDNGLIPGNILFNSDGNYFYLNNCFINQINYYIITTNMKISLTFNKLNHYNCFNNNISKNYLFKFNYFLIFFKLLF